MTLAKIFAAFSAVSHRSCAESRWRSGKTMLAIWGHQISSSLPTSFRNATSSASVWSSSAIQDSAGLRQDTTALSQRHIPSAFPAIPALFDNSRAPGPIDWGCSSANMRSIKHN